MGVPADDAAACKWFRQAAEHGNVAAMMGLATMRCLGHGVGQSEEQARAWFTKAGGIGDRWIIDNPALGPPGIQIYDLPTLDKLWHSRWYSHKSPGTSRPIILTR